MNKKPNSFKEEIEKMKSPKWTHISIVLIYTENLRLLYIVKSTD